MCQLLLNVDRGLTLHEDVNSQAGDVIWSHPFDKLKGSADDNIRLLFLEFATDTGDIVSPVEFSLKFISIPI